MVVAFAHEPLHPYEPTLDILRAEARLFEQLDCAPDPDHEPRRCWTYIGPISADGRARIRTGRVNLSVHDAGWLPNAPLEDDELVPRAVECGNKWCVRFSHLELVPKRRTHATISLEMRRGIYLARYPITTWVTPMTQEAIAHRYGISQPRVQVILREEARRVERAHRRQNR